MKCDAAMRGVVLAVLLIGHAAAGSREQVQSACDHDVLQCLSESDCRLCDDNVAGLAVCGLYGPMAAAVIADIARVGVSAGRG